MKSSASVGLVLELLSLLKRVVVIIEGGVEALDSREEEGALEIGAMGRDVFSWKFNSYFLLDIRI